MLTRILTPFIIAITVAQTTNANLVQMRKEMDAFQKPMVESLKNTLEKDPEFSKIYKMYIDELTALAQIQDEKEKMQKIEVASLKYEDFFNRAMKKAKVNPEHSKKKAAEITKKYSGKKAKYTLLSGKFLTYIMWLETQKQEQEPVQVGEQEFIAPFEFEHSQSGGGGEIFVNLERGKLTAKISRYGLGFYENKAGLGMFLRLAWEARRVRVSTRIGGVDYYAAAVSIGGGAGAKASSVIDLVNEDGRICKESVVHAEAIAPVAWYAHVSGTDTTVFACEMTAPPLNQDLAIRFQGVAEVSVAGNSTGNVRVHGTAQPIRARLLN